MLRRLLDEQEGFQLCGALYFDRVCTELGWTREIFLEKGWAFVDDKPTLAPNEKNFLTFLAELSSLSLTLYKWGMILFNIENGLWDDIHLVFEKNGVYYHIDDDHAQGLILREGHTHGGMIFHAKGHAPLFQILLTLYRLDVTQAVLIPMEEQDKGKSAMSVSFDLSTKADDLVVQTLQEEFGQGKMRFEQLSTLFAANFG